MEYIRKLPLLLGLASAILVGLAGYAGGIKNSENVFKMLIAMVTFHIVGCLIRDTIISIHDAREKKKKQQEEEQKRLEQEKRREEERQRRNAEKQKGSNLDLVAGDQLDLGSGDEDFEAFPVAEFIKKELNQ